MTVIGTPAWLRDEEPDSDEVPGRRPAAAIDERVWRYTIFIAALVTIARGVGPLFGRRGRR